LVAYVLALVHHASPSLVPFVATWYEVSAGDIDMISTEIFPRGVSTLEKRIAPMNLGIFSLALTIPENDVLFTYSM